jgi:hypothetical protein
VVTSADYAFLKNQTGLSFGNLSTHIYKLEDTGYISVAKWIKGKKNPNDDSPDRGRPVRLQHLQAQHAATPGRPA